MAEPSSNEAVVPPMKDLTTDNITENTIRINSQCPDARMKYVLERLVSHLHDFARETRLNMREWMAGIEFLTATGKMCSEVRQEFILLSDILGLSLLVDSISHPKPPSSTEGSVLGPFHTHHTPSLSSGASISADPHGTPCLIVCNIKSSSGDPIPDVKIDIWETDSSGNYDVQRPDREAKFPPAEGRLRGADGRCIMRSDALGSFHFKAIIPVSYAIPDDGPVGKLLEKLGRHPYRPAHVHFMFEKEGWDHLITTLFISSDPYITSDAVFGVKSSLCISPFPASSTLAKQYNVEEGSAVIEYNFVLVSDEQARNLRDQKSAEALEKLGRKVKLVGAEGLPVPDLD